jgi:hypothetical protein
VSPHLGESVVSSRALSPAKLPDLPPNANSNSHEAAALPLGGRIKVDPWNGRLTLLKAQSIRASIGEDRRFVAGDPNYILINSQGSA